MKKVVVAIAAAAVLVTGVVFVIAQKRSRGDGHMGRHGGPGMFLRGLDLTDDQKAKAKEIFDASRTSVEPLMKQLHENRQKIAGLGTDGKFDQAQVEAAAAEQGSLTSQLIVERAKAKAQVFAILTDEQKAKAAEMRTKAGERFGRGKGHGGKRGGMEF